MTELEFLVNEGKINDNYGFCGVAYVCKYGGNCKNVICSHCEFNGNMQLCI